MSSKYLRIIELYRPVLDSAIDPGCLVNEKNEIIYANLSMRSLLGLKNKDLKHKKFVFCDILKLNCCLPVCQIQQTLLSEVPIRLDEIPAQRGNKKYRMTLKVAPIFSPDGLKTDPPVGAFIVARDTSGEVILQAKYHRVLELLEQKDTQIENLNEQLIRLQHGLRKVRTNRAA